MAVDPKPLLQYLDLTKPASQVIVDLINYCNGTTLTADMLTYEIPPQAIDGEHNTIVKANSTSSSYYEGSVEITYNRIDFADVFQGLSDYLVAESSVSFVSDLIALINATYKLNLTRDDFLDAPLSESGADAVSFVLKANPNSLIYVGETTLRVTNSHTTTATEENVIMRTYTFVDQMPLRIKHNMNTVDFMESIRGIDNRRIFANVVVIDEMEFEVEFTEPESGRITVIFGVNK